MTRACVQSSELCAASRAALTRSHRPQMESAGLRTGSRRRRLDQLQRSSGEPSSQAAAAGDARPPGGAAAGSGGARALAEPLGLAAMPSAWLKALSVALPRYAPREYERMEDPSVVCLLRTCRTLRDAVLGARPVEVTVDNEIGILHYHTTPLAEKVAVLRLQILAHRILVRSLQANVRLPFSRINDKQDTALLTLRIFSTAMERLEGTLPSTPHMIFDKVSMGGHLLAPGLARACPNLERLTLLDARFFAPGAVKERDGDGAVEPLPPLPAPDAARLSALTKLRRITLRNVEEEYNRSARAKDKPHVCDDAYVAEQLFPQLAALPALDELQVLGSDLPLLLLQHRSTLLSATLTHLHWQHKQHQESYFGPVDGALDRDLPLQHLAAQLPALRRLVLPREVLRDAQVAALLRHPTLEELVCEDLRLAGVHHGAQQQCRWRRLVLVHVHLDQLARLPYSALQANGCVVRQYQLRDALWEFPYAEDNERQWPLDEVTIYADGADPSMPQRVAELCAAWPSLVQGLPVTVSAACEGFSAAALLAVLAGPVAQLQPRHLTVAALDTCSGQWDPTGVLQDLVRHVPQSVEHLRMHHCCFSYEEWATLMSLLCLETQVRELYLGRWAQLNHIPFARLLADMCVAATRAVGLVLDLHDEEFVREHWGYREALELAVELAMEKAGHSHVQLAFAPDWPQRWGAPPEEQEDEEGQGGQEEGQGQGQGEQAQEQGEPAQA